MTENDTPLDFPSAETIAGRYEIVSLLGRGGMGSVYLARDRELDELVALKTLSKDLVDMTGAMERFRREVKLARKVTHKNVARTFDIGEHAGLRFLTMEYIDGESLGARITRDGALAPLTAVEIARAIAEGLRAAHEAGVVHRDLKPDNVIVGKDGRVMITDFGIARAFDAQAAAGLTGGRPLGTPAYMSPEQVEGKATDHRADIYALGEIVYEMLTGECPFRGDSVFAIAAARLVNPPPDPCKLRVSVPQALGAFVQKAMARQPQDRHADVAELLAALAAVPLAVLTPSASGVASFELGATQPMTDELLPLATPAGSLIPPTTPSSPNLHGAKVLAVIPFKNLGPKDDDYLASALTESLVDTLSMAQGLRVPPLGAVRAVYTDGEDPRALGHRMHAHVVASGSVARDGENLRVTARLAGVEDGFQIWAQRLTGHPSDILRLSDQTADAIVSGLSIEKRTHERDLPEDPIVLDLYLRAQHELHNPIENDAIKLLNEALARSPDEPAILALYARAQLHPFNFSRDLVVADEAGRLAHDAATRALSLAPNAALPHFALGELARAYGRDVEAAREYGLALRADPRLAEAHFWLGTFRARAGDPEGGLRAMKRALLLDPAYYVASREIILTRELMGEPEAADEAFRAPPPDGPLSTPYWHNRGTVIMWRDDAKAAREAMAITPNGPKPPALYMLQVVADRKMDTAQIDELDQMSRVGSASSARTVFFRKITAAIAMAGRQEERAMQALREADAAGMHDILWLTQIRTLAPLRMRAEYKEIEARTRARADAILAIVKKL